MKGTGELWNMTDDELITLADENSAGWHTAETQEEKDAYHAENTEINKILDSRRGDTTTFDPVTGKWTTQRGTSAGQGSAGGGAKFSYEAAPDYISKNQNLINAALEKILGREAFSYDPETDPSYQQYKDQYTRMGKLAMEDTLGQVSARTGGLASSYAGSAAQGSYNQYMSALGDKIPELRQLAYEMYKDEGDTQRANLNMLLGLEEMDYNKYRDKLGQYNADRDFAYGSWNDQRLFEEDQRRDQRDFGYKVSRDEEADRQNQYNKDLAAAEYLAGAGKFGKLAEILGFSEEETQALVEKYVQEENMTREEAARKVADWYAGWGDFSKLEEMEVDTSYAEQMQNYDLQQAAASLTNMKSGGSGGGNGKINDINANIYQSLYDSGTRTENDAYALLLGAGYSSAEAKEMAGYFAGWAEKKERTILRPYAYNQLKMLRNGVRQTEKDKIWSVEKALMNQDINDDEAKYILEQLGY